MVVYLFKLVGFLGLQDRALARLASIGLKRVVRSTIVLKRLGQARLRAILADLFLQNLLEVFDDFFFVALQREVVVLDRFDLFLEVDQEISVFL